MLFEVYRGQWVNVLPPAAEQVKCFTLLFLLFHRSFLDRYILQRYVFEGGILDREVRIRDLQYLSHQRCQQIRSLHHDAKTTRQRITHLRPRHVILEIIDTSSRILHERRHS